MRFFDWLWSFAQSHRHAVTFALVGFLIVILIFTINFWRTLLLLAVVGACVFAGTIVDKGGMGALRDFLDRILPKR